MRAINLNAFLLAAVLVPATALPQGVLEEITVTAQRREQSLQDVPVSVTAFTGEGLARARINSAQGYLRLVPNVSFDDASQRGGSRGVNIAIRGVSNVNTDESAFIQSIGVYLDEFSVASVANATVNPQLYDLERIEVLRGPQGTFFGRNSVGGALNLTTKKPTDQLEGEIKVGGRTFEETGEQFDIAGMINVPVNDQFAMRFAGYYEDNSGRVENIVPGGEDSGHDYTMLRGALRWEPTDRVNVDFMLMYTDEDQGIDEAVPAGVWDTDSVATFFLNNPDGTTFSEPLDDGQGFWPNNRDKVAHTSIGQKTELESTIAVLKLNWQIGDINMHWISGVIDTEREKIFDNDLVPEDIVRRYEANEATSWSTELRFEWEKEKFDLIGGFLYSDDEIELKGLSSGPGGGLGVITGVTGAADGGVSLGPVPGDGNRYQFQGGPGIVDFATVPNPGGGDAPLPPVGDLTGGGLAPPDGFYLWVLGDVTGNPGQITPDRDWPLCLGCNLREFELSSWAVFGDFTWHATDQLDVILGGRYTEDDTSPTITAFGLWRTPRIPDPSDPTGATPLQWGNSKTYTDFSPRFGLDYQWTDDVSVYGMVSKGYKAGGFSLSYNSAPGAPNNGVINEEFNEEELWNYEVGVKSEWFDNRLRVNAAAFYLEWSDFQYDTFFFTVPGDATSNVQLTRNIEDSEALGFEVEFTGAVTDRLTVSGGFGYLDTEVTSDSQATLSGQFTVDLKGEPLPRSPEWTANLIADYVWPLGDNELFFRGEWSYRDESFSTIEDVTYLQTSGQPVLLDQSLPPGPTNTVAVIPDRSDGFPFVAPDHHVFNFRAGYSLGESWEFVVFVENAFDEEYFTGAGDNFGLSGFRLKPHPRAFGGLVSYRFGGN
jgi:outer membrane receptor protein involved in Fe transport